MKCDGESDLLTILKRTDVSDLKYDVFILRAGDKSQKSDRIQVRDWRFIQKIIHEMSIGLRQTVADRGI